MSETYKVTGEKLYYMGYEIAELKPEKVPATIFDNFLVDIGIKKNRHGGLRND